jgi:hypothetical protein
MSVPETLGFALITWLVGSFALAALVGSAIRRANTPKR